MNAKPVATVEGSTWIMTSTFDGPLVVGEQSRAVSIRRGRKSGRVLSRSEQHGIYVGVQFMEEEGKDFHMFRDGASGGVPQANWGFPTNQGPF